MSRSETMQLNPALLPDSCAPSYCRRNDLEPQGSGPLAALEQSDRQPAYPVLEHPSVLLLDYAVIPEPTTGVIVRGDYSLPACQACSYPYCP